MPDFPKNPSAPISTEDVAFILDKWEEFGLEQSFRAETVLLTGGTGFFGKWITQAFLAAEERWKSGNKLFILTRNKKRTLNACPWLYHSCVELVEGDVRTVKLNGRFSTIVHGAAAASQTLNENRPEEMFDTIVAGTRHILNIARETGCRNFQFVSSGGIYGKQPSELSHVSESFGGSPDPLDPKSAYGEAKRAAEFLCAMDARREGYRLTVPRCFAFVGPYLPLDAHFAAGNFVLNVLRDEPIQIHGDGTAVRSYLYAADLVIWLMVILAKGGSGRAYNVGAETDYSIGSLADEVHHVGIKVCPSRAQLENPVTIAKQSDPNGKPLRYVPSTRAARSELGLTAWTTLDAAIDKTLRWNLQI